MPYSIRIIHQLFFFLSSAKEKKNETWPDEFHQLLHKKKYITIVVCLF
jgi:hypothetical protein